MPKLARAKKVKPMKSKAPGADNASDAFLGDEGLAELKRLIQLVRTSGIGELEIQSGGRTVRISAQGVVSSLPPTAVPSHPVHVDRAPAPAATGGNAEKTDNRLAIVSPMVGTFYRAPAPDADPYVEPGDRVEVGQTVCIVEAMKLMNEIESEVKGRVVQVLVDNAQPVEFGQKLFLVEPD